MFDRVLFSHARTAAATATLALIAAVLHLGTAAPAAAADPTAPTAPTAVTARAGVNQAKVYFAAPTSDGGSPVTSFTATSVPDGKICSAGPTQTSCYVTGLSNGQGYSFNVTATNALGASPASVTNTVTPATDTTDPVLVSTEVTPDRVSSLGGDTIAVKLHITDDLSGRANPSGGLDANPAILFDHRTSDATFGFTRAVTRISGDEYDGIYAASVTVPAGTAPGIWDLTVYPIRDNAGNSTFFLTRPGVVVGAPKPPTTPVATLDTTTEARDVIVTWSPPSDNGGNVITGYQVTDSYTNTTQSVTGTTLSKAFPDIPSTTAVTFTVVAVNSAGPSNASAPSAPVTVPAAAPSAPTAVTATRGDTLAQVTWTAPTTTNGAPVTSYTVTATPGGASVSTSASTTTVSVTGLSNGTAYTFAVTATNAAGTSPEAISAPVTPAGVPAAVSDTSAVAGDRSATITWAEPGSNGGASLTGYIVTATPGGASVQAGPSATTATLTGLSNGTVYTFTVTARNDVGDAAPSAPTEPVTPAGAPSAVTGVGVARGDRSLTVRWSPASPNGSPVTGYIVTYNGITRTLAPTVTSVMLTGLKNGITYRVQVAAVNARGTSAASAAVAGVPAGKPGAVAKPTAKVNGHTLTITWAAASANGSAVTRYTITGAKPATKNVVGSARKVVFKALKPGTYRIRITARNSIGAGAPSPIVIVKIRK